MGTAPTELTLGPNLFNWAPETWRDFYFRIADEAPVSVVYLGETICSKRAPLFRDHYETVAERLRTAGKTVVHATLGETASRVDRRLVSDVCERTSDLVEANDASAAFHLRGRTHCIGPLMNVYNEETLRFLASKGARNICLPVELPFSAIGVHAFSFILLQAILKKQRRFLMGQGFWVMWVAFILLAIGLYVLTWLFAFALTGATVPLASAAITIALAWGCVPLVLALLSGLHDMIDLFDEPVA